MSELQTRRSATKRRRLHTLDLVSPTEPPRNLMQLSTDGQVDLTHLSRKQQHAWATSIIAQLQVLQTRTAPINQLPNELVVEILSYLREDANDITWIRAANICRYWRSVALSTPRLWANIVVTISRGISFLRACLNRAGDIDVTISIDIDVGIGIEWLHLLSSHKTNIISMELPLPYTFIRTSDTDTTALEFPMPKLEFLALAVGPVHQILRDPAPGQFPCLRSLTLDNISFQWMPSMFSSVVSLRLVYYNDPTSSKSFVGAVEACPHLESLELVDFHPDKDAVPGHLRTIVLPQLRRLFVENYRREHISFLLDQLDLPPGCKLSLDCSNSFHWQHYSHIASDIANILPEAVTNRLHCFSEASYLVVSVTDQDYIKVEAGLDGSTPGTGSKVLFDLRMRSIGSVEFPSSLISNVLYRFSSVFASSPLTSLEVTGEHDLHEPGWRLVLVDFPLLEQLTLNCFKGTCMLGGALCALYPSDSGALVCPQLRKLRIKIDVLSPEDRNIIVEYLDHRARQQPRLAFLQLESAVNAYSTIDEQKEARRVNFPDTFIALAMALVDELRVI
ncbi:hypothetical protein B0H21DRAFT_158304 [Amylocystis lapponica]|nr:hypothetical protein B0H21DRAFT_158304 [Amylocystis lapponica]